LEEKEIQGGGGAIKHPPQPNPKRIQNVIFKRPCKYTACPLKVADLPLALQAVDFKNVMLSQTYSIYYFFYIFPLSCNNLFWGAINQITFLGYNFVEIEFKMINKKNR
jgi:hypothetical protein